MVKSGLTLRTDVSQYRLAAHFGVALAHPRLHALAPVRARPGSAGRGARSKRRLSRRLRARPDLHADARGSARRGNRCRHGLQHLAAHRWRICAAWSRRGFALVPQPVREPSHGSVRAPHARLRRRAGRARAIGVACAERRGPAAYWQRVHACALRLAASGARGVDAASIRADCARACPSGRRHRRLRGRALSLLARAPRRLRRRKLKSQRAPDRGRR